MPEPLNRWFERWLRQQEETGQITTPEHRWRLAMIGDQAASESTIRAPAQHELARICVGMNWLLFLLFCSNPLAMFYFGFTGAGWIMLTVLLSAVTLIGYPIYILVGMVGERRSLARRDWFICLGSLAGIFAFVLLSGLVLGLINLMELGIRTRVEQAGPTDCIQTWAAAVSQRPEMLGSKWLNSAQSPTLAPTQAIPENAGNVPAASIPACVLRLKPDYISVWPADDGQEYVRISWGGGFEHFGIIVGPPSLRLGSTAHPVSARYWKPGIYIFDE